MDWGAWIKKRVSELPLESPGFLCSVISAEYKGEYGSFLPGGLLGFFLRLFSSTAGTFSQGQRLAWFQHGDTERGSEPRRWPAVLVLSFCLCPAFPGPFHHHLDKHAHSIRPSKRMCLKRTVALRSAPFLRASHWRYYPFGSLNREARG